MEEENKKNYITKATIIAAVIGFLLGIAGMFLVGWSLDYFAHSAGMAKLLHGEETVATIDGEAISTQNIYNIAKRINGFKITLNQADKIIFNDMYELTENEEKQAKEEAEYYIDYYSEMGHLEDFLLANGFANEEELLEDIKTRIKTDKYAYDFLETKLEEGAVQKYYDENKDELETYNSEHILVKVSDKVTDEQALALANEIIGKLNEGKAFSEVVEEYKDKIVHEELGYQGKNASLEQTYIDELVALKDGEYSKTPVKTSYGYHIVHRLATSTFEDLRGTIIEILSKDTLSKDGNIIYKAIVDLRKEKGFEIYDEEIKKMYENYCDELYGTEEHTH